ncbi:MAG: hypothetical protein JW874_00980 [Spirochaetales bacterium]|nr:hypothetical protein [Spirochaetales bacterium]
MIVIAFLSIGSFTVYCLIGTMCLFQDRKSRIHRLFFLFCLSYALWSLSKAVLALDISAALRVFWQKTGYISSLTYEVFTLQFFLLLTGYIKKIHRPRAVLYGLWTLPAVFFVAELFFHAIQKDFPGGFWYIGMHVFANSYNFISLALVTWWARKTGLRRIKLQARLIIITGLVTILLTVLSDFVLGILGITSLTPVIILLWISSLYYITGKYRFMGITEQIISRDIIQVIDEYIAVYESDNRIVMINKSLSELTGLETGSHSGVLSGPYEKQLKSGPDGKHGGGPEKLRLVISDRSGNPVPVNAEYKILRDEFNDALGTLFIGRKAPDIMQLRRQYDLTGRETEIVQHLLTGRSNGSIASATGITANTLKTHITAIYNKLGVSSRMELLHLLEDFSL